MRYVLICLTVFTAALTAARGFAQERAYGEPTETVKTERRREGAQINEVGVFNLVGDRLSFTPTGEETAIRVLENLALERIGLVVQESRTKRDWKVTGVVTEYRGSNYLLLKHAVLKTATDKATP